MEWDQIEEYSGSLIQHGPNNRRTYLMRLGEGDASEIILHINELCRTRGYTKSFAKVPASKSPCFLVDGWNIEAFVPGFFHGQNDALFLSKYYDPERRQVALEAFTGLCDQLHEIGIEHPSPLPECLYFRICTAEDVERIAGLYRIVFERYPFPIHDSGYIHRTMKEDVVYFGIWDGRNLAALSSAEMEPEELNVEMTDFAVLPDYRGLGLGLYLLGRMDAAMREAGMITAYTIARLKSKGMNATFLKAGYTYSGTLFKNTYISDGVESMNVYYKHLRG
ncbi:MAG: putative beta-lysine N-acetyltransferase [Sediminispirochaetaceae bacterium]